jgi:uncharacterized protein (DUF1697 family)
VPRSWTDLAGARAAALTRGAASTSIAQGNLMERYVAFLRAINVGGHTVKMDHLRTLFGELGFTDVSTVIASGNVIFHTRAKSVHQLEGRIERHLREALGYDVATFVRSVPELAALAQYEPFPRTDIDTPGSTLSVVFFRTPPSDDARQKLLAMRTPTDDFHVSEREAYWLCRTRMSESLVFKKGLLDKVIGIPGTSRNMNTVRRIALLMGEPEAGSR